MVVALGGEGQGARGPTGLGQQGIKSPNLISTLS